MGYPNIKNAVSFVYYLKVAIICNLIFAIPCLLTLLGFGLMEFNYALILFSLSLFVKSPIVGSLGWLITKGSNGKNKLLVFKVIGAMPGMYFSFITGSSLARFFLGQTYLSILFVLTFFIAGIIAGIFLGPKTESWIAA